MSTRTIYALVLLMLITTPLIAQQDTCKPEDRIIDCWERIFPQGQKAAVEGADEAEADVAAANTGLTNLQSSSSSALKDFLSLLSASLESATLEEKGQALTFDWNPKINFLGVNLGDARPLKFQAVFTDGEISSQLQTALVDKADEVTKFNDSIKYEDDVAFSVTFNPQSKTFGRSISSHRTLFQDWFLELIPTADSAEEKSAFASALGASGAVAATQRFDQLDAGKQEAAMIAVAGLAKIRKAQRTEAAKFSGAFTKLLNNQSQIYFSGVYNARRNIVGPNQVSVKGTFEWGPQNLSTFERKNPDCTEANIKANATMCLGKLVTYAENTAKDRLAIAVDYARTNRRFIKLPDLSIEYGIPRLKVLTYSITYGRTLAPVNAKTGGRIDAAFHYEDNSEKNIDNHEKFVLTYTYKVSDKVSVPFSAIYGTDDKDLVDANRKFSANFGLIYKMPELPSLFGGKSGS